MTSIGRVRITVIHIAFALRIDNNTFVFDSRRKALGLETGEVLDGTTQEAACEYDEELDDYIHQLVCDVRVIIESGCPETSEEHNALEPH